MSTQTSDGNKNIHITNQNYDIPDSTLRYEYDLVEDIEPLLQQGRLGVTLNGVRHTPPVFRLHERTGRRVAAVPNEGPSIRDDSDREQFVRYSCGFAMHMQFKECPSTADYWGQSQQMILSIHGIHNEWMTNNCSISDYHAGRNDDGYYQMELEIDKFVVVE